METRGSWLCLVALAALPLGTARAQCRSREVGDVVQDCTHPSDSGRHKVADGLFAFFTRNPLTAP